MNRSPAVSRLKPLGVSILKNCTHENVQQMKSVVEDLDDESVQSLLDYIIFPVRARLNTPLQEKVVITCIDFFSSVFKKCDILDWQLFSDIFTFMVSKLYDPRELNQVLNGCEELKVAVCKNISCLVLRSSEKVLNEMYSLSFRPKLAHAFYMLNLMLNCEKSKHLLIVVISTIGTLTYSKTMIEHRYEMTEAIASEALASCLPGLAIALQKVICGDYKQGHNVLTKSLIVLSDLIVLVVGDHSFDNMYANNMSSEVYSFAYKSEKLSGSDANKPTKEEIPVILKDKSWFTTVSGNLKIIIENIAGSVVNNDHWKVRLDFLNFASSVLLKCTKTLENCVPILLPAVFELYVDDHDSVSSKCKDVLKEFTEHFQNNNSSSLCTILEENLKNVASEIMSRKLSASDSKKLSSVRCLHGYVEILSSMFDSIYFSMSVLEKTILSMLTLLEFDLSVLSVIEEIPALDSLVVSNLPWPKKKFKYFEDEAILNTVSKICFSLGHIQNSQLLIDFLVDKLSNSDIYSLQCIFIIGTIIRGFSFTNSDQQYSYLVNDAIELFTSNALLDPPIHDSTESNVEPKISSNVAIPNPAFNKNKLQVCLVLEAISKCAECLKINFKTHLIKVLCPVLEKAGSSNFVISQYGCLCLSTISQSCGYDTVKELIKDNADYITNIVLINFNSYFCKPEVAVVLRVVMKHCDSEALVLFRDLIYQIFLNIDYNQDKGYFLMQILYSVVVSIKTWFPSVGITSEETRAIKSTTDNCLKSAILQYISLKKTLNDLSDETEDIKTELPIEDHDNYPETENKAEIPIYINVTCEIFRRCIHLQSSENRFFRMLVLDTVEQCILVLRDSETQLHPLVHEFWDPFMKRFLEESFVSKAFGVLMTVVNECKDFVRHRTFKDVMPKLILFLKGEHSQSNTKYNYKNYQWSNGHSLQVLILSEIGQLCSKLDVDNKDICDVANVCLPYLEHTQPEVLQDAAIKSLKELAKLNSDAVWFLWNVLFCDEKVCIPPCDVFRPVFFPCSNSTLTVSKLDDILF